MKVFFTAVLALLIPVSVFAAATVPTQSVWMEPADAKPGDAITLNALIYNNQTQSATITVVFASATETIGTVPLTISKASAKTASIPWNMPNTPTTVTVRVTKAVGVNKKDIPALLGDVGTIQIGALVVAEKLPSSSSIKAFFAPFFSRIETWRTKQADIWTTKRDTLRTELGITKEAVLKKVLTPETPAPVAPTETTTTSNGSGMQYVSLVYTTVLASFFAHVAFFYIALAILTLAILRFIIGRFF